MPALPIEHELTDGEWYSPFDSHVIGKWDAEAKMMVYPGIGEKKVTEPMLRLGPVARYHPPIEEPTNFGAVVEDGRKRRYVRVGTPDGSTDVRWFGAGHGMRTWSELSQPITVLADGVPDSNGESK